MNRLQYISKKQQPAPAQSGGIGCLTIVGIIFVVLKLTGNIDWSWWWVLSPFIIQAFFIVLVLGIIYAVLGSGRRLR